MIAFLSLILLVAILAYFGARREDGMIDARPGGPDLDHKELIWRRILILWAIPIVTSIAHCYPHRLELGFWDGVGMGVCHAAAAWAEFTFLHRLSLNLMRGMDWRYVSPGNDYDWRFISFNEPNQWNQDIAKDHHTFNYTNSPGYRKEIHRAGTLAYCFEVTVLAASIVGVVAILNH